MLISPFGYTLTIKDRSLCLPSADFNSKLESLDSIDSVMYKTPGVEILHEGRLFCEDAKEAATHGWIEVGAIADKSHRRRGPDLIACVHLIQESESRVLWDYAKQNIASTQLAYRSGYQMNAGTDMSGGGKANGGDGKVEGIYYQPWPSA